jgi:hypothetical protein
MFDTLIAFLKVANDFKAPADRDQNKMYVLFVSFTASADPRAPERRYTASASLWAHLGPKYAFFTHYNDTIDYDLKRSCPS